MMKKMLLALLLLLTLTSATAEGTKPKVYKYEDYSYILEIDGTIEITKSQERIPS